MTLGDPDEGPLAHHAAAVARGAKCLQCPLYNCGQGPVMGNIRPGSLITVVGEAPGNSEVETGRILEGQAGEVVFEALKEGGLSSEQVTVTSAILCRPPGGHMLDYELGLKAAHKKEVTAAKKAKREAQPLITPQMCCQPRLERDIADSGAMTLLGLGSEGLKALAHVTKLPFATNKVPPGQVRVASLKKQHGSPVLVPDGRIITSAMHPAFVMYGNTKFMPVVRSDIKRAAFIAKRGNFIDWNEPEFILKPSIDTCINVLERMRDASQLVTVDIETDGIDTQRTKIRCIGLGATIEGRELIIVVPLRHMDGRTWWPPGEESRLYAALTALLEKNPLSGHNLSFDTQVLLQHRILFNRGKRWMDTMLGHHNTKESELPHDLGFVAARAFEAPRWKDDADHKNVENVDDYWLHLYCAKDVLGEMRLVAPIAQQISEQGFINTFQVDTKLAPVARDMGDLGLNVNEARRRLYFDILDKAVNEHVVELRSITGIPDFNPNASKQVSRFLYITKGLSPPYATDGREWEELSDEDEEIQLDTDDPEVILAEAATNELSLLRLLELGVDDHTRKFIETQLGFRGLSKCRSTQMGLKWEEIDGHIVLTDVHRKKGRIHTENRGEFSGLSILHPNWKLHVIRTGRWAVNPNVQAWPERIVWNVALYRAWVAKGLKSFNPDGSDGIINTRAIVEAPPGYKIIGADYMAIELRIYAVMAQDQLLLDAIYTKKDPHALNFATMQARTPDEVMTWYDRVKNSPDSVKKNMRNIAKRFFFLCLKEGELVLTQRGEVPIEQVLCTDLLWDGVEWVAHEGVIYKGEAEVIYHDGLWATEDHEVWVEDGRKLTHGRAAAEGLRGLRTGAGGQPRQWLEGREGAVAREWSVVPADPLSRLPEDTSARSAHALGQAGAAMPVMLEVARPTSDVALHTLCSGEAALSEPKQLRMEVLWGPGNQVQVENGRRGDSLGIGAPEPHAGHDARPHRQQQGVRAGEHPLRLDAHEHLQPLELQAARVVGLQAEGVAVRGEARPEAAATGLDASAGVGARTSSHDFRDAQQGVATNRKVVRVYDIVNAGPRHRFTVSNRLVANCVYNGQEDTLFKTMSSDREPDGRLSFPGLEPKMTKMWFGNLHRGHPEMKAWHAACSRAWSTHGFVSTIIDGRRCYFLGGMDEQAIPNHTIQGSAASIANRAMITIAEHCPHRGWGSMAGPILQVHDYIGLQAPDPRVKEAEELLDFAMPYEHNGMRFDIERKTGQRWDQT